MFKEEERVLEPELISSEEVNMIGAPLQDRGSPESEQVNKLENYKLLIRDELSRKQRDSGNRPTGRRAVEFAEFVGVHYYRRAVTDRNSMATDSGAIDSHRRILQEYGDRSNRQENNVIE
jgi:hypothetical protein